MEIEYTMIYYRIKSFNEKEEEWDEFPSNFVCLSKKNFGVYDFKINDKVYEY